MPSFATLPSMFHNVYRVADLGAPRDHHALFIETDPETGGGVIMQVTGNIQNGMTFEEKSAQRPEISPGFVGKTHLGTVSASKRGLVGEVCRSIPAPKKQFHGPRRIYPDEPLRRCQEWTKEAVEALKANGALE